MGIMEKKMETTVMDYMQDSQSGGMKYGCFKESHLS